MFDFDHPGVLISGLIVSLIGTAMFIYGKKQSELRPMLAGVALCVIPVFVTSMLVLWLSAAACVGGLYALNKVA